MRIGELAKRAQVTVKAVRYYERIGLLEPARAENGYRSFDEDHVRAVTEIRELGRIGIPPQKAGPFLECLDLGHEHGDECISSLAVYREAIAEVDGMIATLAARRHVLQRRLNSSAARTFPKSRQSPTTRPCPKGSRCWRTTERPTTCRGCLFPACDCRRATAAACDSTNWGRVAP